MPKFYLHDEALVGSRRFQYIESVYEAINEAGIEAAAAGGGGGGGGDNVGEGAGVGAGLDEAGLAAMVAEAAESFKLNADIYGEDGRASRAAAAWGGARSLGGYALERVWGAKEQRDIFGRLVKRKAEAPQPFR